MPRGKIHVQLELLYHPAASLLSTIPLLMLLAAASGPNLSPPSWQPHCRLESTILLQGQRWARRGVQRAGCHREQLPAEA